MRSASALSAASRACLPSSGFAGADCVGVSEGAVLATGVGGGDGVAAGSAGAAGSGEGVGSGWAAICLLAHHACPKPTGIVIGHRINTATTSPSRTETIRDETSRTGPRSKKLKKLDAMNRGIFGPPQVSFPAFGFRGLLLAGPDDPGHPVEPPHRKNQIGMGGLKGGGVYRLGPAPPQGLGPHPP